MPGARHAAGARRRSSEAAASEPPSPSTKKGRHHGGQAAEGQQERGEPQGSVRGRVAGQSPDLYFARVADIEGFPDIAGLFKDTADAETGHAFGHLDFLKEVGDSATGEPIGKAEKNLKASVAGETYEYAQMYPGMAKTARD